MAKATPGLAGLGAGAILTLAAGLLTACGGAPERQPPPQRMAAPAPPTTPPAGAFQNGAIAPPQAAVPGDAAPVSADPVAGGETAIYGSNVKLGATREAIEGELGQGMGESVGPEGHEVQYMQGMPDMGAMMPSGGMMAAQEAVGTVAGLAGFLGPAGAIGGAVAGQAMALGSQYSAGTAGRPDFSKAVMIMVTYRDGRAVHINVQRLGAMMGGG